MNSTETSKPGKGMKQIQDIYETEYWSKKYGVSSDELKKAGSGKDLPAKIVAAHLKERSFSL